jgi:hypothetical protein
MLTPAPESVGKILCLGFSPSNLSALSAFVVIKTPKTFTTETTEDTENAQKNQTPSRAETHCFKPKVETLPDPNAL